MSENSGMVRPPSRVADDAPHGSRGPRRAELRPNTGRESLAEGTAEALVHQFENLHEGPQVFHHVVALGDASVPALDRFVRGPSQALHQARSLGVDALAAIGTPLAVAALTHALRDSISRKLDPISFEAESVLVNHIAEHLSRFSDIEVNEALLEALRCRPYPYCAAALGLLGDPRAIPLLIECLSDDPARPAAMGALRRFGRTALTALTQALRERCANGESESPSRVDGRAAAARLIGESLGSDTLVNALAVPALRKALEDRETRVRLEAALALAARGVPGAGEAVGILVMALDEVDWARAQTIVDALVRLGPEAERFVLGVLCVRPRNDAERRRCLRAVDVAGRLGTEAAAARLRYLAASTDPRLRLTVIAALSRIPNVDGALLARFLTDRNADVRRRAFQALRRRNVLPASSAIELLGDGDRDIRRLATATVRQNLNAALPSLQRAACGFGAPLHGWIPRFRLWWHACALIVLSAGSTTYPV